MKTYFFSYFAAHKGLIQYVVQVYCNYNVVFQKLEIHTVKMRLVPACYTSGRGISLNRALFQLRPLHYCTYNLLCLPHANTPHERPCFPVIGYALTCVLARLHEQLLGRLVGQLYAHINSELNTIYHGVDGVGQVGIGFNFSDKLLRVAPN